MIRGSEQVSKKFPSCTLQRFGILSHFRACSFLISQKMWRAGVDTKVNADNAGDDDDWETDPDFVVSARLD